MFKQFEIFDPKTINCKKNITIICATAVDKKFWLLIINNNKSKLLQKDVEFFENISETIAQTKQHNFAVKALIFGNQICSKAKQNLKNLKWTIYNDFM